MLPPRQQSRVGGLQTSLSLVSSDPRLSPEDPRSNSDNLRESPTESASSRETWPTADAIAAKKMENGKADIDCPDQSVIRRVSSADRISLQDIARERVDVIHEKMLRLPGEFLEELKTGLRVILEGGNGMQHRDEFFILQKLVQSRSDLTAKTLIRAHRVQLEILVAINTGIQGFLHPNISLSQPSLIEIFLYKRCRNIACQNQLPADDCSCETCTNNSGFCNLCMCTICSKFDFEVNTCRWIGCDLCSHWTHTDCAIREQLICMGPPVKSGSGPSEMVFRCQSCSRTSELLGWVKDVFQHCAPSWDGDSLMRELDFAKGFSTRWKMIISRLEQVPSMLSNLSSHPCFSKNALCKEQLQALSKSLEGTIESAELCVKEKYEGKLQMQSDLDALIGKMDLNLRDCGLLIKTGMLGEATLPLNASSVSGSATESDAAIHNNIRELLARLQIGHLEAKHKALDSVVEVMKEDEKNVLAVFSRSNIAALVQLLTATSTRIREKTVTVICSLAESGSCEDWLVSEGVLPPLIRLVESGSAVGKEKAAISLQRLSMSAETSREIVGHGGVCPLVELCQTGDSVSQAAAACTLKNISAVPEVRQVLAQEGIVRIMINLLTCGMLLGSKEYAAECLQNLTASNESLKKSVISEGGVRSLLAYLDGPLPQESAVAALRNLVGSVSETALVSLGLLPRLVHVLKSGSPGAQNAAASGICRVSSSTEMKKLVGEAGCIPLLVKMLEAKQNSAREISAQALASLLTVSQNRREAKKDDKSVPNLVQLLDPSPQNNAKKYAVTCLGLISSSKKCKKLMISYGAIGYLKKLTEMDTPGAKKLHERLERGKLRSLFGKK